MEMIINFSKDEEEALNALIDLSISFGLEHELFVTGDQKFLNTHEWVIQKPFKNHGILDWYDEGCGKVKFKFTNLGLAVIKNYRPDVIEKMKPFLPFRYPHVNEHYLPNVKVKILKEKAPSN